MKKLLFILFLTISVIANATNYYVAPASVGGNDANTGLTTASPMLTLNHAWTHVSAGDIIYLRGGTYNYADEQTLTSKSGTSGSHITIQNYPNESPVLDFSGHSNTGMKSGIRLESISYVDFIGFRVTNVYQPNSYEGTRNGIYGILLRSDVSNCLFDRIEVDHIGGWGFSMFDNITYVTFLNCDSHHNSDPYTN
jgi:hypothetical protein